MYFNYLKVAKKKMKFHSTLTNNNFISFYGANFYLKKMKNLTVE